MQFTVGVLMIGSLYWRGEGRQNWRDWRLEPVHGNKDWNVRAPIRYGRCSRNGTYTMVFADLPEHQLGQAKVVQCRGLISSPQDLVAEAEWLWAAENNNVPSSPTSSPEHRISPNGKWGCVALMINPDSRVPTELVNVWTDRVSKDTNYNANSARLVDSRGFLQIGWPYLVDGHEPVPTDLLLATSNDPTPPAPDSETIAAAWNKQDVNKGEYFRRNRQSGIYTFQDQEILRFLH